MKIEITVRDSDAQIWKYFLQKRYGTKANLKTLCKVAILKEVAAEAKKDIPGGDLLAKELDIDSKKVENKIKKA